MPMILFLLGLNYGMVYSLQPCLRESNLLPLFLGFLVELIFFILLGFYLLCTIDPMIGSVSLSDEGLMLCTVLKRQLHFKWEEISDIHLECQGRLNQIPFLVFNAGSKKKRGCCLSFKGLRNKKEFVELVRQWRQYYTSENSVSAELK